MGKTLLLATVAAAGLALGIASADAADIEAAPEPAGWYVSLFGGVSWLEDVDADYTYDSGDSTVHVSTDSGFILGGAVGTHLLDTLRVELEVAYSENDADGFAPDTDPPSDAIGTFNIFTVMGNAWLDLPLTEFFKPYVGGGAGLAFVDADGIGYANDGVHFDSSETVFAAQVGAGLRWQLAEHTALDIGYRYRGNEGPTFDVNNSHIPNATDYHADWMWSHNVIAGISFGF